MSPGERGYYDSVPSIIKARAHAAFGRAVAEGTVDRPSVCEECYTNERRIIAHHDDYARPLAVRGLCESCHGKHHFAMRPIGWRRCEYDAGYKRRMPLLKRLRSARAAHGHTRSMAAKEIGVAMETVSKWENNLRMMGSSALIDALRAYVAAAPAKD